jgi:hypothetical protein
MEEDDDDYYYYSFTISVSSSHCIASNEGMFSKYIIPNDAKEAVAA